MGVSPIDFDRDGRVDWIVPGVYGESRLLWHRGGATCAIVADRADVAGVGDPYFAWGSYGFDADLDGWPDLLVLRQEPDASRPTRPSRRGPSTSSSTAATAPSSRWAGAIGGACRPGAPLRAALAARPVGCFAMDRAGPVFFLDALRLRGRQALLRLRGTVSAFDGTGARVSVEGESVVWVVGGQSTFGGEHAQVLQLPARRPGRGARVTVRWPSGVEQRGVEVRADDLATAVEPAAVVVAPRVIRADGAATARRRRPARRGPRASSSRSGRRRVGGRGGDGRGGEVRRVIPIAPSGASEARVAVTLDGVALRVRPRVVFLRELQAVRWGRRRGTRALSATHRGLHQMTTAELPLILRGVVARRELDGTRHRTPCAKLAGVGGVSARDGEDLNALPCGAPRRRGRRARVVERAEPRAVSRRAQRRVGQRAAGKSPEQKEAKNQVGRDLEVQRAAGSLRPTAV